MELLGANYTFLNERLARHYGIPNVLRQSNSSKVTLVRQHMRGGFSGKGKHPDRNVLRESHIAGPSRQMDSENILANAPATATWQRVRRRETIRRRQASDDAQRMAQHRTKCCLLQLPSAHGSHRLSVENFDAVGRWQKSRHAMIPGRCHGSLPSGVTFTGVAGLKKALLDHPDAFVATASEKLLTYAVGRGLDYYDAPTVRAIVRDARSKNYRFSSLIAGVVKSTPFQMRRSQ